MAEPLVVGRWKTVLAPVSVRVSSNSSSFITPSGSVALAPMEMLADLPILMYGAALVSQEPGLTVRAVGVFGLRL